MSVVVTVQICEGDVGAVIVVKVEKGGVRVIIQRMGRGRGNSTSGGRNLGRGSSGRGTGNSSDLGGGKLRVGLGGGRH